MRWIPIAVSLLFLGNSIARADEADTHLKQCEVYKRAGKLDNAIQECDKAISLRETASAHFILGSIYRQRQQWDYSMAHLEAAAKMQPNWAPIRANLGAAYLRQGRLDDAQRELEKAVELDPKDP